MTAPIAKVDDQLVPEIVGVGYFPSPNEAEVWLVSQQSLANHKRLTGRIVQLNGRITF